MELYIERYRKRPRLWVPSCLAIQAVYHIYYLNTDHGEEACGRV
jgi:hypothetical protein